MEEGMQFMVRFAEERDHDDLLELSSQLDRARQALQQYLDENG